MATENKILQEWISGGRVEYKGEHGIVVNKDGEFLIAINRYYVHIIPGKQIAVKIGKRWYVSRAPSWRGRAREMAEEVLYKYLPMYYYLVHA